MIIKMTEEGFETETGFGTLKIGAMEDGIRPNQLMLASIAGCSASVFRRILTKQRIDIEDLTVEAEIVERIPEEANRIKKIHLHFIVKGSQLNEEKLKRNLELSRKHCPMAVSVEGRIDIEESLEMIE